MDGGVERIEEDVVLRAVRRQAHRILVQSLAWTAVVVTVLMLLP